MDCCNSGTNMNLPYCYVNGEEQEREYNTAFMANDDDYEEGMDGDEQYS